MHPFAPWIRTAYIHTTNHGTDIATPGIMPAGNVVVITGTSAGVGRALARRFAREGASIALLARGSVGLEATAAEVQKLGGQPLPIQVDVADAAAVEAAAEQIEQELGPIDIWINNAAVVVFGTAEQMSPEEIRRVSDVTYHGAVWGTMAALKRMRTRNRGTIVQVGSGASYRALPLMSSYSGAKYALRGFTDALRVELLHAGIDVHLTMVHPAAINTPFYSWTRNLMPRRIKPMPPVYQPEVVASTIHWAAYARRREVYLGWPAVLGILANKVAPGLVDRLLARTAITGQLADELVQPNQPDNLFDPVEGNFGAQGVWGARAKSPALLEQFIARLGAGGIRTAIAVALGLMLDDD
jgi:NAD(P)-dependent dehydrogenase (short-subunit alcohol dehydrogenase family)